MVSSGRSSRRDGGQRWLAVGLVFTCLVLLVDASLKSQSPTATRQLAAQAWVDRALAVVGQSNVEGVELNGFRRSTVAGLTAEQVTADLAAMTAGAGGTYRALEALRAPATLQAPAGLLQTCLLVRSEAAASFASAVRASLGAAGAATAPVQHLAAAVQQLRLADQAYLLFAARLPPSLAGRAPPSVWITGAGLYSTTDLQVFLTALHNRVSLAPVHQLSILSVGTTPTSMGTTGPAQPVEILPPTAALALTVIVGNTGNQEETGLTVTAGLSLPAGKPPVSRTLDLGAGAVTTVRLAPFAPPYGPTVTLTVTVTAAGGTAPPVIRTLQFQMPAPTTTTTTTTAPTTSTTARPTTTTTPASTTVPTTTAPATTTAPTTAPPTTTAPTAPATTAPKPGTRTTPTT